MQLKGKRIQTKHAPTAQFVSLHISVVVFPSELTESKMNRIKVMKQRALFKINI